MNEPIPVPGWYASMIGSPSVPHEEALSGLPARLVRIGDRVGALRGALLWLAARRAPLLGLIRGEPGTGAVILLEGLRPRGRRLVLFEFIARDQPRRAPLRLLRRLRAALEGWALRRTLAVAQVLTEGERDLYAARFSLPASRFRHIPWPLSRTGGELPVPPSDSRRVVSSGRAYCDWDTVLAAARGRDWDLTLISGAAEEPALKRRAAGMATVLSELSRQDHDARLREAAVYALVLRRTAVSAGQVRLAAAVDAGVPVVATDVPALEGYVSVESARLVPPADPEELGAAVDELLDDPAERRRLREAAHSRARGWTYTEYFAAIRELLVEVGSGG